MKIKVLVAVLVLLYGLSPVIPHYVHAGLVWVGDKVITLSDKEDDNHLQAVQRHIAHPTSEDGLVYRDR